MTWLEKVMAEVPDVYLQPEEPREPLPSDAKLVGQLTDYEKRLLGVVRQMEEEMDCEDNAHEALHSSGNSHEISDCEEYNVRTAIADAKYSTVLTLLLIELRERLGLPENMFAFDGENIYSLPDPTFQEIRSSFRRIGDLKHLTKESVPTIFMPPIDPEKTH